MSFRVKLDENLSLAHVNLLREAGYDADRVNEQGLSGATDERVAWPLPIRPSPGFAAHLRHRADGPWPGIRSGPLF
jgi:hypothetical protein